MTKISNGRVVIEVPDEKAQHYCTSMGYHIVKDEVQSEEATKPVAPKRGRPPKKAG